MVREFETEAGKRGPRGGAQGPSELRAGGCAQTAAAGQPPLLRPEAVAERDGRDTCRDSREPSQRPASPAFDRTHLAPPSAVLLRDWCGFPTFVSSSHRLSNSTACPLRRRRLAEGGFVRRFSSSFQARPRERARVSRQDRFCRRWANIVATRRVLQRIARRSLARRPRPGGAGAAESR